MTPTKGDVKHWLKSIGKNRHWLAEQCGTEKGTVNNWLSPSGPFPATAMLKLQALMSQYKPELSESNDTILPHRIILDISEDRMKQYEQIASEQGISLRQWLTEQADQAVKTYQSRKESHHPSVSQFPFIGKQINRKYSTQIIGNIAAGFLSESDTIPSTIYTDRPLKKNEYVVRVEGSSMEPLIPNGSLVIIRKHTSSDIPKPGSIVEYNDGRGVTLKKLILKKNPETGQSEYVLQPINPAFKDITPIEGGQISGIYVETLVNYCQ